tara:strand:- start:1593 stop:1721 length:129 start_codon:yes stop_codon:yes gene_type:complete
MIYIHYFIISYISLPSLFERREERRGERECVRGVKKPKKPKM